MLAAISLVCSFTLGLMSAAMGRVVWRGPPPNVERPVRAWLGRVLVLLVLIAATTLSGLIYRRANSEALMTAISAQE